MREKRNLIWLSIVIILLAVMTLIFIEKEIIRNLAIGVTGSALVSFILVTSEYFSQKHTVLKEIYLQLVEIQKLFVERFRFIKKGKGFEEKAIEECLTLIPSTFFSRNSLSVIKAHIQEEVSKIADSDEFKNLSALYPNTPTEPGELQGDKAATAILESRIFMIINNIDVILQIVEKNRRIKIDQPFRPLSYFIDSIYQFFANIFEKMGIEKWKDTLQDRMRITEIRKELWDPVISMLAAFEQFTPGIFGPFREGNDKITLSFLQKYYFNATDGAFKHHAYKHKPYDVESPYSQFLSGLTKGLQKLEDIVFYRKGK